MAFATETKYNSHSSVVLIIVDIIIVITIIFISSSINSINIIIISIIIIRIIIILFVKDMVKKLHPRAINVIINSCPNFKVIT